MAAITQDPKDPSFAFFLKISRFASWSMFSVASASNITIGETSGQFPGFINLNTFSLIKTVKEPKQAGGGKIQSWNLQVGVHMVFP